MAAVAARPRPLLAAGVLGWGLGMFLDGIVLHQILQWHHLVSELEPADTLAGLEANTRWDGLFHGAAWLVALAGVVLLWRARRRAPGEWRLSALIGPLLMGWGAFNVFDQVVFHLALGAHHVRDVEDYAIYDWSYTALGVALIAGGWALARRRP